jgi:ABC-type transport system substrate-binding protein
LAGRRTDQLLVPALGRDASVYPLTGAAVATARRWLAKARSKPTKLVLYTWNTPFPIAVAQIFAFDLRQIGIDVDVKTYEQLTLLQKAGTRGEPYDVVLNGWRPDYPDGFAFFGILLSSTSLNRPGNWNLSYFDDPKTTARMKAIVRLTGEARRRAWAELDVDLMRTNPPWAPIIHTTGRTFISKSFGCYLFHPWEGVDFAAACKK